MLNFLRQRPSEDLFKKYDLNKMCSVYMHRESTEIIVATLYFDDIYYERSEGIDLCNTEDKEAFGELVGERFFASKRLANKPGFKNYKKSDWPAFKFSKMRSIKLFEKSFIYFSVCGSNRANVTVDLETAALPCGITLKESCNPLDTVVLADKLLKLRKYFLKWETDQSYVSSGF